MDEKPGAIRADQIKRGIDSERNDLDRNVRELEQKVKTATDWRAQFQRKPMVGVGIAFGAGFLLSKMIGGRRPLRSTVPKR